MATPPPIGAELPLTVQLVSVSVPPLYRPPPAVSPNAVSGYGLLAELPLTLQSDSVGAVVLHAATIAGGHAGAIAGGLPPVIVSPEIEAVTNASTWKTRLAPPPLTVTPAAGPVIVSVPVVLLSSSWVPVRVIVCGRLEHVGSKVMRVCRGSGVVEGDRLWQAQEACAWDEGIARGIHDQAAVDQAGVCQIEQSVEEPVAVATTV